MTALMGGCRLLQVVRLIISLKTSWVEPSAEVKVLFWKLERACRKQRSVVINEVLGRNWFKHASLNELGYNGVPTLMRCTGLCPVGSLSGHSPRGLMERGGAKHILPVCA